MESGQAVKTVRRDYQNLAWFSRVEVIAQNLKSY